MEALAHEVACLRRAFPGSVAWGVSARRPRRFSWRRGFGCTPKMQLVFRAVTGCLQRLFDVNHLFGGLNDWFHLKALRNRPALLTMAVEDGFDGGDPHLLSKIDRFVVEWPEGRETLEKRGIAANQMSFIPPPVDLRRFRPAAATDGPFTLLFASSPDRADWLHGRGVALLLDVAERRPMVRFRLLWRPWGNSCSTVESWIKLRGLSNVELVSGCFANMAEQYHAAHATILPFVDRARCKPAPNSLIEGLACGRPAIVTHQVGLASLVAEAGAGIRCAADADAIADSIDRLQCDWTTASCRARELAEQRFAIGDFIASYARLYEELTHA